MSVPRMLVDNNPNKKVIWFSFGVFGFGFFFDIFETGENTTKTFSSIIPIRCKY